MREMAVFLGFVLAVSAPVEAFAASAQAEEVGVPDGRLAASALTSGDYGKAVKRLSLIAPDAANDPARLINLGNAYAGLGRMNDAREAYKSARYAPEGMLVLADGSEASSRDIARKAMRRLDASY
ncbi:MAG TPA: tetratricopeptide repeat protein [Rhizorhapis sp.]